MLFSGGQFIEVSVRRADSGGEIFQDSNYNNSVLDGDKHMLSKSF